MKTNLTADQKATVIALAAEAYVSAANAKGWIPTEIGELKHPCIRGAECDAAATGVVNPYLPWFSSKRAADAWCRKVNAVATECNYQTALNIARRNSAELMEA